MPSQSSAGKKLGWSPGFVAMSLRKIVTVRQVRALQVRKLILFAKITVCRFNMGFFFGKGTLCRFNITPNSAAGTVFRSNMEATCARGTAMLKQQGDDFSRLPFSVCAGASGVRGDVDPRRLCGVSVSFPRKNDPFKISARKGGSLQNQALARYL